MFKLPGIELVVFITDTDLKRKTMHCFLFCRRLVSPLPESTVNCKSDYDLISDMAGRSYADLIFLLSYYSDMPFFSLILKSNFVLCPDCLSLLHFQHVFRHFAQITCLSYFFGVGSLHMSFMSGGLEELYVI